MKIFKLITYLLITIPGLVIAQNATGTIFEDKNGNGKLDSNEAGIPNVAVTNGENVVLTDKKGKYKLQASNDFIISVIKPSGYDYPVNENNLPLFYYNHKPKGSPDLKYEGVEATSDLPRKLDFPLIKNDDEKENFSALIFGDPQVYNEDQVSYFEKGLVSQVNKNENILFGISLGDLVGNNLDLFNPYIQVIKKIELPWYNVLGNHDLNFDVDRDEHSDETFEKFFGPSNYAFNYGKVHFIVLDDILYPDPRDNKGYWGGFREDQLNFIENDLKHVPKDHLIVLSFHIPLSEPNGDAFRNEDRQRLFEILKDFPNTLSLSAHTHIQKQDFFNKDDGWHGENPHHHFNVGTTSGDWYSGKLNDNGIPVSTMRDGTPKGYAVINFKDNKYTIDYQVAGESKDYKMQIFSPRVVAKDQNTKAGIYVNYFMGSENDKVEYRIDDGSWSVMKYVEDYDPSYVAMVYEWDLTEELFSGRRPSNPIKSKHLWRAKIPTKLAEGVHTIEVKVEDMFGRIFTQTHEYRIVPQDK
ncbi:MULTISPECIES: calcineurin-like phosphoesterase C-terminal domain-containing protein [Salegentibacter]|uniref:3',5'-cyclic AMP phosphodiesterase CpdA n=1 Tax=Salegentibacter agarivorans TaxID=345907 RepID=A0A1I2LW75_9FLAO|nr:MULTISPECIES: calcineurin-like phosphoesterase family protein [Salegentibacter]SFF82740.1 3',5'-cyclic AMP phosphodiesterase CpdA [Salegentibacter agarivorans]